MLFTRRWRQAALVIPAAVVVLATSASAARPPLGQLLLSGIRADPAAPGGICPIPAAGPPRCPADAGEPAADPAGSGPRWLASGTIPGTTAGQRAMAADALLGIRLLTQNDGAVAAAWYPAWTYAWPRDSSWAAAALTATGHGGTALTILRFIARMQLPSGIWAARYQLDGAGPVRDGRPDELDANGWFPWSAWFWYQAQPRTAAAQGGLATLWPAVARAADATMARLGRDGLPPVSMDYWEDRVSAVTIGIAAPLYAGLRAAADLARARGDSGDARRWTAAAHRLGAAIQARFGATGYQRTPAAGSGADAAVTFLGPPFTPATPAVRRAVSGAARTLTLANGGIEPGQAWPGTPGEAWTPETAFFALYDAASGDQAGAARWLSWLAAHRTADGALPEQVNAAGQPASVAPLAWTDAITLLAMTAERHPLPMP
ncbi:MAG TPA: glycoside hydrolase family 15 [Streptosporangiaceae bacterium]|jgi:GH15 family glucan-1,4-alpha-glucosidase